MTKSKIVTTVLCLILLTVFVGLAYTGGPPKYQASGAFYSTSVDVNGDGIPGAISHLQGQSPSLVEFLSLPPYSWESSRSDGVHFLGKSIAGFQTRGFPPLKMKIKVVTKCDAFTIVSL